MHPFRKLLLISMGRESSFEKDPSPDMWMHLFKMAKYQALLGVLNAGVHRLPAAQLPPEHLLADWDRLTDRIAEIHARHESQVAELEALFERKGLRGCVLKGTGLAWLYPDPGRRQCGDIDVWVPGPRKAVIEAQIRQCEIWQERIGKQLSLHDDPYDYLHIIYSFRSEFIKSTLTWLNSLQ